jgi:hypothetical protein
MKTLNNCGFYTFTTHKHIERCSWIDETWAKDQHIYHITDKVDTRENYIHSTDDHSYSSSMYKNFYAMYYALNYHINKFDWFFFIGDDVFVYVNNLEKAIEKLNKEDNKMYGEIANCWPNDRTLFYVLGGGGILFNKTSLSAFCKYNHFSITELLDRFIFSDVAIGIIGRDAKIQNENIAGIYSQPPEFYNITNPNECISFHYIKTKEQFDYLNSFNI